MISFFARVQSRLRHISDDTLASLLSGELGSWRTVSVNAHLSGCWQCRARRDELEKAAQLVVEYRKGNLASCLPLDPRYRQSFLSKVKGTTDKPKAAASWSRSIPQIRRSLSAMNPVFASVVVVLLSGVVLFWIWQRSATTVTAEDLLRRAELSDQEHSSQRSTGVLYQQLAVRTGATSFQHSVYRDLAGHRRARPVALRGAELEVQRKLESAGVNWDKPLSARDYKGWHDRQKNLRDEVRRTGNSELTLTTTFLGGEVAQESLTVREGDFHPIRRMVEMRDQETVEVAELDYAVLSWNAVNQGLFEPLAASAAIPPIAPSIRAAFPPSLPTALQVDVAELTARTVLNELGADSQDQILVTHADAGVVVKGIVGTNDRKRELVRRLNQIAYVHPEILSTEEMERHPIASVPADLRTRAGNSVQLYSASTQLAPLAKFLEEANAPPEQLSRSSKQLLDASLKVQQAGADLLELWERFASITGLPQPSRVRLETLTHTYRQTIVEGLKAELAVLGQIGLVDQAVVGAATDPGLSGSPAALQQALRQNQKFCQELIVASENQPRPASAVAGDIRASAGRVTTLLNAISKPSPQP